MVRNRYVWTEEWINWFRYITRWWLPLPGIYDCDICGEKCFRGVAVRRQKCFLVGPTSAVGSAQWLAQLAEGSGKRWNNKDAISQTHSWLSTVCSLNRISLGLLRLPPLLGQSCTCLTLAIPTLPLKLFISCEKVVRRAQEEKKQESWKEGKRQMWLWPDWNNDKLLFADLKKCTPWVGEVRRSFGN